MSWQFCGSGRTCSSTSWSTSATASPTAPRPASRRCSNVGMEVTVAEYRNGNEKENSVRKITGLNKATDVTMKRGVIGSLNLYQLARPDPERRPGRAADGHHPAPERGPHAGRPDLEAPARADHQARQRPVQRQGHGRGDGGADPLLRTPRDGVGVAIASPAIAAGHPVRAAASAARRRPAADGHRGVRRPRRARSARHAGAGRGPGVSSRPCSGATSSWVRSSATGAGGRGAAAACRWRASSATAAVAAGWCASPGRPPRRSSFPSRGSFGWSRHERRAPPGGPTPRRYEPARRAAGPRTSRSGRRRAARGWRSSRRGRLTASLRTGGIGRVRLAAPAPGSGRARPRRRPAVRPRLVDDGLRRAGSRRRARDRQRRPRVTLGAVEAFRSGTPVPDVDGRVRWVGDLPDGHASGTRRRSRGGCRRDDDQCRDLARRGADRGRLGSPGRRGRDLVADGGGRADRTGRRRAVAR